MTWFVDGKTMRETVVTAIRILGIDPGSQITGFGIVERRRRANGTGALGQHPHGRRAQRAPAQTSSSAVAQVVREYRPAEIAIERVFLQPQCR